MVGIAGIDLSGLSIIPEVQAAADRLSQIKGSPEDDPRRLLMERMSPSVLSFLIETADLLSLDAILAALVGMRSEGRRVGQECVSKCRSWWSTYKKKKKQCHKQPYN